MARKTIGERLAQLEDQRKTLQIRLSKQERAIDTRRNVLIGALVLHRLANDRDVHIGGGLEA
ncbi:mobilization protein, partial [Rhizobium johnstonii]